MKKILWIVCLTSQVWANAPKVGDHVLYKRWIKENGVERTIYQSREILSYDENEKGFVVQLGQNTGPGWRYWNETLHFLDYSYGLYENCPGSYTVLKTELGSLDVCERDQSTNHSQYFDWHADVPFGLVKNSYQDSDLEFRTELVEYKSK